MDVLLLLFCTVFTLSAEGRHVGYQQNPSPVFFEPSSRDLDVGIAIGVPEDDNSIDNNLGNNAGMLYGMAPPQNAGPLHLMVNQQGIPVPLYPADVATNLQPVPQFAQQLQQSIPIPSYSSGFTTNTVSQNMQPSPVYLRQLQQDIPVQGFQSVPLYPQEYRQRMPMEAAPLYPFASSRMPGDMEQIPLYPVAEPARQPQFVYNQQGIPVMTSQPYGDRRVGAFRLRNDRGYQVMMEVPPSPPGPTGGGVLVMEMQATLYRPVQ